MGGRQTTRPTWRRPWPRAGGRHSPAGSSPATREDHLTAQPGGMVLPLPRPQGQQQRPTVPPAHRPLHPGFGAKYHTGRSPARTAAPRAGAWPKRPATPPGAPPRRPPPRRVCPSPRRPTPAAWWCPAPARAPHRAVEGIPHGPQALDPRAGRDGVPPPPAEPSGRAPVAGPRPRVCRAVISACAWVSRPRRPRAAAWAHGHDRRPTRRACQLGPVTSPPPPQARPRTREGRA